MRHLLSPIALTLLGLAAAPALAAERHWTFIGGCGSADWFGKPNGVNAEGKTTCWGTSATGGSGLAVPTATDDVYIHHSHPSQDLANTFSLGAIGEARVGQARSLWLSGLNGRYASLAVDRDRLQIGRHLVVGDAGLAKFFQTGGTVDTDSLALGFGAGAVGVYELHGGVLNVTQGPPQQLLSAMWVGWAQEGRGQFLQTGGTLNANSVVITQRGQSDPRAGSFMELSGGQTTLSAGVVVGSDGTGNYVPAGAGRLRISGSAAVQSEVVNVSSRGLLELQGGHLTLNQLETQADTLSLTDGVLEFRGAAFHGQSGTSLPLAYGGGLGGGTPTVRLAPGSSLVLPALQVGEFGRGRLEVGAGAVLSTGSAGLGTSKLLGLGLATGEGSARVAGGVWINTGNLALGTLGVAQLEVLEGAKLSSGSASLGDGGTVDPTLGRNLARIAGSGTEWKNSGDLWVGGGATGSGRISDLWLSDGAFLQVGGQLFVHAGSSLVVDGGAWTAARTVNEGAIDILSTGEVQVAGRLSLHAGSRLSTATSLSFLGDVDMASGASLESDHILRFEGAVRLHAGAQFIGDGTKVFAGGLSLGGPPGEFLDTSSHALVVFADTNTFWAELGGSAPGSFDRYVSNGEIRLGGTLVLSPWQGYQGLPGDSFDLFDGALSGGFARIDTQAFTLAQGLHWDFSRLSSEGVVSLTAAPVPEPGAWALWMAGLLGFGGVARRRRRAV